MKLYSVAVPYTTLGPSGTILTADETRMDETKLADAVARGVLIEIEVHGGEGHRSP